MEDRRLHPKNARAPTLVTPSGIVIDVKEAQPLNAEPPRLPTTLFGILIDWRE